ncbi:MAG: sulfatase/phosphatase domain-containing protein, partial [Chloroflexota bacterium]
ATMAGVDLHQGQTQRNYIFAESRRGGQYMVRSQSYKLLLCQDTTQSQFFDLVQDPLEMKNVIDEPNYQTHVTEFKNALLNWTLFDAPSPVYLDNQAPVLQTVNVPDPSDDHLTESDAYFRAQMQRYYDHTNTSGSSGE